MKSRFIRYSTAKSGYSLLELGLIIGVMAVLSCFALVSFGNMGEERDAKMVQAAQASLQSIVSEGAARLDMRPADFGDDQFQAVLLAAQASIGQRTGTNSSSVQLSRAGRNYTLTIASTGRQAVFSLSTSGNVDLIRVDNFGSYTASNGVIKKGP